MERTHAEPYRPLLLLVNGQLNNTAELSRMLEENGMAVQSVDSAQDGLNYLHQHFCDALLVEVSPYDMPASQIVAAARNRFPFLPIIVLARKEKMNEAIGALNAGAFHLIPVPFDTRQTLSALRRLLVFHHDSMTPVRNFPGLKQSIQFEVPSSLDYVTGAANQIIELLLRFGIITIAEVNIKIAIVEALTNAMEHGHGFNPKLRVPVVVTIDEKQGEIKISDAGKGFNHRELPDPTSPENLYKPRGRGIYMMYRLMDEVHFNRKGNCVRLIKRRRQLDPA